MSGKVLLVTLIALSSAQFIPQNRRPNRDRAITINSELYDVVPQDGANVKINHGTIRNAGINVNDGTLRTNLNSGQNNFPPRDDAFVVEGAAFSRQDEDRRYDVHSSEGRRTVGCSYTIDVDCLNNGRSNQNYNNGEDLRSQANSNQSNPNTNNEQIYNEHSDPNLNLQATNYQVRTLNERTSNDQTNSRKRDQNNLNAQNVNNNERIDTQSVDQNQQGRDENLRINVNQTSSRQGDKNSRIYESTDRSDKNKLRDKNLYQNNQDNTENDRTTNHQGNSKANQGKNEALNKKQNIFQTTQATTFGHRNDNNQQTNQNSGSSDKYFESGSNFDTNSRAIVDKLAANNQNYDREAMEKEINNQISKMFFEESTEPKLKTTQDNELTARSDSVGDKDKWVWGVQDGKQNDTATVPSVDDRAAFVGDQCPTGKIKFNKVCVDKD